MNHSGGGKRSWVAYVCRTCGGVALTAAPNSKAELITLILPAPQDVDESVPERPRTFLLQAIASVHAPAGAVMLAASSVDSMLKAKGYDSGSLYGRIDQAATDHLITPEMAAWAHEIRLDANDQRHADESAPLPDEADAEKVIEFSRALAQFLFVLPSRVDRGRSV